MLRLAQGRAVRKLRVDSARSARDVHLCAATHGDVRFSSAFLSAPVRPVPAHSYANRVALTGEPRRVPAQRGGRSSFFDERSTKRSAQRSRERCA